ncbi:hypothetical protein IWW34DRAFT_902505 [Fusarium oxysporum f. sp. albedinis]|nr:hypothetical protein IWW34DRAFT_902505 [Fusarium oxysporum f. sp. albedinis]KAK2470811.1 hypothetical protein H9L39_17042 [Fusarium oxysporum f. sp. albedinis]
MQYASSSSFSFASHVYESFPTERPVFENRNFLAGLGNRIAQRPIADEKTLESFLHYSVEDPVRAIIQELKQEEEVRRSFQIGDGVIFENHPHALSDVAEEAIERETQSTPPRTPGHRKRSQTAATGSDLRLSIRQYCVFPSHHALHFRV